MKNKIQRMAELISAPFRKLSNFLQKPLTAFCERHEKELHTARNVLNKYSLVFHFLWAMLLEFMIEAFSRHSLNASVRFVVQRPWVFLYNSLLIFMTLMIVYLVKRRAFFRVLISVVWILGGYINGTVLSNRVTPFTAQDMKLLGDLARIINQYMSPGKLVANGVLIIAAVILLAIFWKKAPKYQGKIHYIRNAAGCLAVVGIFMGATNLALENRILSSYFGNIAFAYKDYGFPYCFGCSLVGTGMDKPHAYGEKSVLKLSSWEESVPEEVPNIIFVQLESFFDVSTVEFLKCSQDPLPNFRSLMKEYSSGTYKVPSVGAGTANTEFESITGMNMRYFGPGEYPYKTILLKTTCGSVPYSLKDIGYETHAIHNNTGDFYSRNEVFPNLGFDSYTSVEYMDDSVKTETGWTKDQVLVGAVLDCLKSSEGKDYIYTISVQGHGDYPKEKLLDDPKITVSGDLTPEQVNQWEYYVNQVYEMDQFVDALIKAVEAYGEDSVIVFYGDHLPTMNLTEKDVTNRYLFDTSYVIWDNMGLEKEDQTLCAYQVGAEVLDQLDIHTGAMIQYHQNRRGTKNYQKDMEMLQYDLLYGEGYSYGEEGFYEPTEMNMGIIPQKLDRVELTEEGIHIFGKNLTRYTMVYINEDSCTTTFIDEQHLFVEEESLDDGDVIEIKQVSSYKDPLSTEDELIYHAP